MSRAGSDAVLPYDEAVACAFRGAHGVIVVTLLNHQLGIDNVFVDESRIYWDTVGNVWAWTKPTTGG